MQKDKEEGGESEPTTGTVRVCGHYIRGHVESVCHQLAEDPDIRTSFPSNAMVANAGHSIETFDKHYSRPMIPRQKRAFKNHPRSALLSKEEVQLL